MTKQELVDIIAAKTQTTLSSAFLDTPVKNTAKALLKAYTEAVTEAMSRGDNVQLIGFGKFEVRLRKARKGIRLEQHLIFPQRKFQSFVQGQQ